MRVSSILIVACVFFAVAHAARQIGCTYYNGDGCSDASAAGFVPATKECTTFALNTVTKSWIVDCQNGKMSVKEYAADTCSGVKPAITSDAKLDQCVNATLTSAYCTCNSSSYTSISMILAALVVIFSLLF